MTAAPPPPIIVVPLATYDFDNRVRRDEEAVEVSRHFGRRCDPEPAQPLITVAFVLGEDRTRTEYSLSRGEAHALAHALLVACIPPSKETKG